MMFFHNAVSLKSEMFVNRNVIGIVGFQGDEHFMFLCVLDDFIH